MEVKTLATWNTGLSADTVEWCPIPPNTHVFVCGTYLTQQQSRLGSLHLLSLVDSEKVIELLQTIDGIPGILDCKWAPCMLFEKTLLAAATSDGELVIFSLNSGETPKLNSLMKFVLPKKTEAIELLALSLDWLVDGVNVKIAVSDSQGCISVLRLDSNGVEVESKWSAHSFEAWTVHWDKFNPKVCYTGGDDAKLRVYDIQDYHRPLTTCSRHAAGVTSFSSSNKTEYSLLSGSYDEEVVQWDTRQMRNEVATVNIGGGVWRLRRRPADDSMVLAACMYNGHAVFDASLMIVATFKEHESIAYGADWANMDASQFQNLPAQGNSVIATCSFYDQKLAVSVLKNK